jgi:hypothetical protein
VLLEFLAGNPDRPLRTSDEPHRAWGTEGWTTWRDDFILTVQVMEITLEREVAA